MLNDNSKKVQENAARALGNLAVNADNKSRIGTHERAIDGLVELLHSGSDQAKLPTLNDDTKRCMINFMSVEEKIRFSKASRESYQLVQDSFKGKSVDLSYKAINDADLRLFGQCKEINLTQCNKITDAGLAHLTNAMSVNLTCCTKITDAGLAHLTNATYVNLSECTNITDAAKQRLIDRGVTVRNAL